MLKLRPKQIGQKAPKQIVTKVVKCMFLAINYFFFAFYRPDVARAVLQSLLSLVHLIIYSLSHPLVLVAIQAKVMVSKSNCFKQLLCKLVRKTSKALIYVVKF